MEKKGATCQRLNLLLLLTKAPEELLGCPQRGVNSPHMVSQFPQVPKFKFDTSPFTPSLSVSDTHTSIHAQCVLSHVSVDIFKPLCPHPTPSPPKKSPMLKSFQQPVSAKSSILLLLPLVFLFPGMALHGRIHFGLSWLGRGCFGLESHALCLSGLQFG